MTEKTIKSSYKEGSSWKELSSEMQELIESAKNASLDAYAPYSKFHVGAAIRTEDGKIIRGCNQENASFPMCNCAEQVTIQKAFSSNPQTAISHIAIYAEDVPDGIPVAPCGACRQVIKEADIRSGQKMEIILVGKNDSYFIFSDIDILLPFSFDSEKMKS